MNHFRVKFGIVLLGITALAAPARAADVDLTGGVLTFNSPTSVTVANALAIGVVGSSYTIDDPAEVALTLGANALAAGCAVLDADTVTCPMAAIASFSIATGVGDDTIDLTGSVDPATVRGGDGHDTLLGGVAAETWVWMPGEDNDVIDGGAGEDTLEFNGANIGEQIAVTADGATGFTLTRNIGAVTVQADRIEHLTLRTFNGADVIATTALAATAQDIATSGDVSADTLNFDAAGQCAFLDGDTFEVFGRQPVVIAGITSYTLSNQVCGAFVDVISDVLSVMSLTSAENALTVALDGDAYVLTDTGEGLSLTPQAIDHGCTPVTAAVVTCPAALLESFSISTRHGNDTIVLGGVTLPAMVTGGTGVDTIVGGDTDDMFIWTPGDGSDAIDGGPGNDLLDFNGNNISEQFYIGPDGATGFDLFRNIGEVHVHADGIETLLLKTFDGADSVVATGLKATAQTFLTGADASPDGLFVDAIGLCAFPQGDSVQFVGRLPVLFAGFGTVDITNAFCRMDPCDGALPTTGCTVNGVRNSLCEGRDGDDVIVGTDAPDVIVGGGGRDRIRAGAGDDLVCGDAGDDVLVGSLDQDTLVGGDDDDRLIGGTGQDDVDGGLGDDRVEGGADPDLLRGGEGVDKVDGGRADDICTDTDQAGPFPRCEL